MSICVAFGRAALSFVLKEKRKRKKKKEEKKEEEETDVMSTVLCSSRRVRLLSEELRSKVRAR